MSIGKRLFDIAASGVGLILLSPVLVVIALLVKLDSSGSVFFRQERVGRNGRVFRIYKFRTMRSETSDKGAQLTVSDDPRITRIGTTLRHYKLDELPQLINVLVGEMSLVGPRPEVPRYVAAWEDRIKSIVLSVRPGLTALASIEFRNESALLAASEDPERKYLDEIAPAKNKLAVLYVQNWSFWLDIKIIGKTFAAILH
jgi:lipopolysaccharide/colanic/teichoic acid biosynthesis glycosyltransferase